MVDARRAVKPLGIVEGRAFNSLHAPDACFCAGLVPLPGKIANRAGCKLRRKPLGGSCKPLRRDIRPLLLAGVRPGYERLAVFNATQPLALLLGLPRLFAGVVLLVLKVFPVPHQDNDRDRTYAEPPQTADAAFALLLAAILGSARDHLFGQLDAPWAKSLSLADLKKAGGPTVVADSTHAGIVAEGRLTASHTPGVS